MPQLWLVSQAVRVAVQANVRDTFSAERQVRSRIFSFARSFSGDLDRRGVSTPISEPSY